MTNWGDDLCWDLSGWKRATAGVQVGWMFDDAVCGESRKERGANRHGRSRKCVWIAFSHRPTCNFRPQPSTPSLLRPPRPLSRSTTQSTHSRSLSLSLSLSAVSPSGEAQTPLQRKNFLGDVKKKKEGESGN